MVENPPSNAGDSGSILGQGTQSPHAVFHIPHSISPHRATTEPTRSGARSPQQEKPLQAATRESLHAETKTQHSQNKK